jgi:3-(3-hydroxy-phenyl)propionate hydroxylase
MFPQPRLSDGRLMDEAIGQRFAIVGETELLAKSRPDAVHLPGVGSEWLATHSLRAALLRPDRYVFAVAK